MSRFHWLSSFGLLLLASSVHGEIKVQVFHNDNDRSSSAFQFDRDIRPVKGDAAENATFKLVAGRADPNSGPFTVLHDGKLPTEEDQPRANFFLNVGTNSGLMLVDLGREVSLKQINTFSWHPNTRGPQVYKLYIPGESSDPAALGEKSPVEAGWKALATVDTRRADKPAGGQYAVSIADPSGNLGKYRYLLFEIATADPGYAFANTFFSEIDAIDAENSAQLAFAGVDLSGPGKLLVQADNGNYEISIDTSETPDLREWVEKDLAPVVKDWYPKIVAMLPSEGYAPPAQVQIIFSKDMRGVAAASGSRIRCAATWFRQNLQGEAKGAVVHELVHVVQQYGRARRTNPNATRPPGWLVEGIPDYIRWFLYEPQSKGAEITARNIDRAKYDANYRISGNFLNWVVNTYDREIIRKLNAALREGKYTEDIWKTNAQKTVQELGEEWLKQHKDKLRAAGE